MPNIPDYIFYDKAECGVHQENGTCEGCIPFEQGLCQFGDPKHMKRDVCEDCGKEIPGTSWASHPTKVGKLVIVHQKYCSSCGLKRDPSCKYYTENRTLPDGIYDVTGLNILYFDTEEVGAWNNPEKHQENPDIVSFMKEFPDYVVAQAYQAATIYFISSRPKEIGKEVWKAGDTFNYGSCNLLKGLPDSILILAEDD